jgi:hypothetical protein
VLLVTTSLVVASFSVRCGYRVSDINNPHLLEVRKTCQTVQIKRAAAKQHK